MAIILALYCKITWNYGEQFKISKNGIELAGAKCKICLILKSCCFKLEMAKLLIQLDLALSK